MDIFQVACWVFCACSARLISHGNERLLFTKPAFLTACGFWIYRGPSISLDAFLGPAALPFSSFQLSLFVLCMVRVPACLPAALGQCVLRHKSAV
jgi:hypothetical protein